MDLLSRAPSWLAGRVRSCTTRDLAARIGQRFAELRARTKLTQAAFAERHGIPLADLKRIEQGARGFNLSTVARIASAIGLDASDIVRLDAPPKPRARGRPRRAR